MGLASLASFLFLKKKKKKLQSNKEVHKYKDTFLKNEKLELIM